MKLNKETKETIKMYQANDWEVDNEMSEYILMRKNTQSAAGHFVVFLFTFWTFGIGNLIYYLFSRKKKKVFK